VAYALFRLECSIRSASILGVVGAGGLGSEIELSVRYDQYDKLATALLAVLAYVIALEAASGFLRRRRIRWTLAAASLGSLAAIFHLDIPWSELLRTGALAGLAIETGGDAIEIARHALPLVVDTVAMAWWATIAAAVIAFAMAPLASRPLAVGSFLPDPPRSRAPLRRLAHATVRGAFQLGRAMPELTLALLFVVWVGPGPTAGALAVGLHTVGVLGRLYSDIYEEVEPGPAAALEATGASRLGVWVHGVLPQVMPRILAFTLYRFEVNVRMTAVVGFVGAGGIGDAIHTAISLFHVADLIVLLAVLLAVVTALDGLGDRLRYRILVGRFSGRGGWRRPTRLSGYRVEEHEQRGDDDAETKADASRPRDPGQRDAVVRLLGAGEE
jgi:phosphonate transport system permease protein